MCNGSNKPEAAGKTPAGIFTGQYGSITRRRSKVTLAPALKKIVSKGIAAGQRANVLNKENPPNKICGELEESL